MADETNTPPTPSAADLSSAAQLSLEQCYEAYKAEALALPEPSLHTMNLDVNGAIITATGCHPKIQSFRKELSAKLGPATDFARIDALPRYTAAFAHAVRLHAIMTETSDPLKDWADELVKDHELLIGDVENLARHGMIDGSALPGLRNHNGYKPLAFNVLSVVELMRKNWSKIAGRSPVTAEQIDAIEAKALRLMKGVGDQEQRLVQATETANMRVRYFHLFLNSYEEGRRAINWLRWFEGDADTYAPSLYQGRGGGNRKADTSGPQPAPADAKGTVPQPAASPAPANGSSANGAAPVHPSNDPFVR